MLIDGTAEGLRLAGQRDHCPLLWEGAGSCAGNLCSRAALTLLMVPAHAGLGDPLVISVLRGAKLIPAAQAALTQPSVSRHMGSALSACAQDWPQLTQGKGSVTDLWLVLGLYIPQTKLTGVAEERNHWRFCLIHKGGFPFLPHPHESRVWWQPQIRQNRVQHKICNPVLIISILHLEAFYSAWSGIENKIRCCGCEPARFREV